MSEYKRKSSAGRPTNKDRMERGEIIVSKRCKVCQSKVADDITRDMLSGMSATAILAKYNPMFGEEFQLNNTNIFSHKKHMSVETVVKADRITSIENSPVLSAQTKAVMIKQYNEKFDKQTTTDNLYAQRLSNLLYIQKEIDELHAKEALGPLTPQEISLRRTLIHDLEGAYRGFNQDLLKHIQLEADIFTKQLSLRYIGELKATYMEFTKKFIDVIVKELDDPTMRMRLIENLSDLLDTIVAPKLDPRAALDADFEEINDLADKAAADQSVKISDTK